MKNLMMVLCALLLSTSAHAEQALSKQLIEKYLESSEQVELLTKANPIIDKQLDEAMMLDKAETVKLIKSLPIYPQIKSAIASYGFDDLDEYLDISYRIMGAVFNSQMKQLPAGMTIDSYIEQMNDQIAAMKTNGMPKEMLAEMEKNIAEQLKSMAFMKKVAASASSADVKFVSENLDWIMSVMPTNGME